MQTSEAASAALRAEIFEQVASALGLEDSADAELLQHEGLLEAALLARCCSLLAGHAAGRNSLDDWCAAVFTEWGPEWFVLEDLLRWTTAKATPGAKRVSEVSRSLCRLAPDDELTGQRLGTVIAARLKDGRRLATEFELQVNPGPGKVKRYRVARRGT